MVKNGLFPFPESSLTRIHMFTQNPLTIQNVNNKYPEMDRDFFDRPNFYTKLPNSDRDYDFFT